MDVDLRHQEHGVGVRRADSAASDLSFPPTEEESYAGHGNEEMDNSISESGAEDSGIDGECQSLDGQPSNEATDTVARLPDGWPRLPQIFRRRSCQFTQVAPVCVQKATAHLELLQTSIENWFKEKQIEQKASSRLERSDQFNLVPLLTTQQTTATGNKGQGSGQGQGYRKEIRFASSPGISPSRQVLTGASSRMTGVSSRLTSASLTDSRASLSVIGKQFDKGDRPTIIPRGIEADIPYLGAEDVLDETITILARLENDRQESCASYHNERDKVQTLSMKIDETAKRRLHEIPKAVQAEHDACIADIQELRWHVSYQGRIRDRNRRKLKVAESFNKQLKDDIAFIKKHRPLMMEKFHLEVNTMAKIDHAQTETTEELNITVDRQENVKSKAVEDQQKASLERQHIKSDLDKVRNELDAISGELAELYSQRNMYLSEMEKFREQTKDNEQELIVLQVKNENAKTAEAMQQKKVKELEGRIREQEYEHKRLEDENQKIIINKDERKVAFDKEIEDMLKTIEMKQVRLKDVLRKNYECDIEIEDLTARLENCAKAKVSDEKNMTRIAKELSRTEEMMKVTLDEFHNVLTINLAIRDQLRSEHDRTSHIEEQLRTTAETLKKQVKEEIHSRNMIQARISTDNTELVKTQGDNKQKKERVNSHVGELEEALRQITEKVEKLRAEHAVRTKKVEALTEEINAITGSHHQLETTLRASLNQLEPKHSNLSAENLSQQKKIDHMDWKEEMMIDKMKDMATSVKMINRVCQTTDKKIKELTDELDEVTIQLDESQQLDLQLTDNLQKVTARLHANGKHHQQLMKGRLETLQKHKRALKENIENNKNVAATYRQLHNQYLILKNQFMDKFDERVNIESAIKDLKQLHSLQLRMHAALQEYYRYRGAYNSAELRRMEEQSNHNGVKVNGLQRDMDDALAKIGHFLTNQMDSIPTDMRQKGKHSDISSANVTNTPTHSVHVSAI